jgi:hypothetical protein
MKPCRIPLFLGASVICCSFLSLSTQAQDYPYDALETQEQVRSELPTEAPTPKETPSGVRVRPQLSFLGVKTGGNFGVIQVPSDSATTSISGIGAEAHVFGSWDFPVHPIATDFQIGYRSYFLSSDFDPLHSVPLALGTFYRNRLGARSSWKIGVRAGIELQIDKDSTGATRVALMAPLTLASLWELQRFILELNVQILRIQSQRGFLSSSALIGFRF